MKQSDFDRRLERHLDELRWLYMEGRVFCGLNALGALRKSNPAFGARRSVDLGRRGRRPAGHRAVF